MKSNKKLTPLEKEKLLDQEEIIEFYYHDKESKTKILIKDKRKIKVALMEMEEYEKKQRSDIMEFECPYNAKTDDPVAEDDYDEIEYEQTEFEQNLEDALQEMTEKLFQKRENEKNISNFFKKNISRFPQKQQLIVFYYYFLDFSVSEIAEIFDVKPQTIDGYLRRINEKLAKFGKKFDL